MSESKTNQADPADPSATEAKLKEPKNTSHKKLWNKWLPIVLLVVLIGVGVTVYVLTNKHGSKKPVTSTAINPNQVCSDSLLKEASAAINKGDLAILKQDQTKILGTKDYNKDINCLYVVEWIALQTGKTDDASKYLAALNAVYLKQTYSKALSVDKINPTQMANDILALQQDAVSNQADDTALEANLHQLDIAGDKATSGQQHNQ